MLYTYHIALYILYYVCPDICCTYVHMYYITCIGPNLGGKSLNLESEIISFWVLTVQQDGVKVSQY